jgi:hypothetical protein
MVLPLLTPERVTESGVRVGLALVEGESASSVIRGETRELAIAGYCRRALAHTSRSTLIAVQRPRARSSARNTDPIPPSPSFSTKRSCVIVSPTSSDGAPSAETARAT